MNGIININKKKGITSHDVVNIVRRKLGIKRVGHTGTLDPVATGVLPICVGVATKLSSAITNGNKTYEVLFRTGIKTDTLDITGNVVATSDKVVSELEIINVINSFLGKISQIPPMYSAIKIDGKKLYELAREGKTVERKARTVTVFDIYDIFIDEDMISFVVECEKGTYIRTLVDDIGEKLGTYASVIDLKRIRTGKFNIDDSIEIDDFETYNDEDISNSIIHLKDYFSDLERITLDETYNTYLYNGNKIKYKSDMESKLYKVFSSFDEFMGVYRYEENVLTPHYFFNLRR